VADLEKYYQLFEFFDTCEVTACPRMKSQNKLQRFTATHSSVKRGKSITYHKQTEQPVTEIKHFSVNYRGYWENI
jgi:hypothetical protein